MCLSRGWAPLKTDALAQRALSGYLQGSGRPHNAFNALQNCPSSTKNPPTRPLSRPNAATNVRPARSRCHWLVSPTLPVQTLCSKPPFQLVASQIFASFFLLLFFFFSSFFSHRHLFPVAQSLDPDNTAHPAATASPQIAPQPYQPDKAGLLLAQTDRLYESEVVSSVPRAASTISFISIDKRKLNLLLPSRLSSRTRSRTFYT